MDTDGTAEQVCNFSELERHLMDRQTRSRRLVCYALHALRQRIKRAELNVMYGVSWRKVFR